MLPGNIDNVHENTLLQLTDQGLYCPAGDFHIDPWQPVPRAVITHAHADHARWGSDRYLTSQEGKNVLQTRLGPGANIDTIPYGEAIDISGVRLSLHPAGHILGSAQVRLELHGEVWVVSGDYRVEADRTCAPFDLQRCHTFVTESTFGLPIFRWSKSDQVFADINAWWRTNKEEGKASLLCGYALGKAQRLLAGVDCGIGPIFTHGAVEKMVADYRATGIELPKTTYVAEAPQDTEWAGALAIAPPSAHGTPWARRFAPVSTAFASGWMRIRGTRRRRAVDRGFVLSDHVDWPGLLASIQATGAERVWVTHGYVAAVVRRLQELGLDAAAVPTRFEGERDEAAEEDPVNRADELGNDDIITPSNRR
ncbi:MAG: ligase-associated DNA damage response exonuclease [Gemmataceae bacterium]